MPHAQILSLINILKNLYLHKRESNHWYTPQQPMIRGQLSKVKIQNNNKSNID